MQIYRYLTGRDDNAFCHRVTKAINEGWELYGSPTLTFDPGQGRAVCGQAIMKTVEDARYDPNMDLGAL